MAEWIRVEDRLPEDEGMLLFCDKDRIVRYGFRRNDSVTELPWCAIRRNGSTTWHWSTHVTHWQPLPEPPQDRT